MIELETKDKKKDKKKKKESDVIQYHEPPEHIQLQENNVEAEK